MRRNFLIAAVLVPVVCFLLFKFQDGDFTLMMYEKISQDPAVALRGKVVWITGASSGIGEYLAYELVKYGCISTVCEKEGRIRESQEELYR